MWRSLRDSAVLVTGGTRGIGLAVGLAFGSRGAHVTLTHRRGSVAAEEVRRRFAEAGAPAPDVVNADATRDDDARRVMERIRGRHQRLDVFVSSVAVVPPIRGLEDYTHRNLEASIDHGAWPFVSHTRIAREVFGSYPRYVVGISSEGAGSLHVHYDFAAASKAVLETLCRYLNYRLGDEGTRVNVVRTRFVSTESLRATFGEQFEPFVERHSPGAFTTPEEVASAVFGLCCGLMDGVAGQVITVDRGASVFENFSRLYDERERNPLPSRQD